MKQIGVAAKKDEFELIAASSALQNTELGSLISNALLGALASDAITLFFLPQDIPTLVEAARQQKINIRIIGRP